MQQMTTHDDPQPVPAGSPDDDYVTIREAAHAVGIPYTTLQGWVNRGKIKRYKRPASAIVYVRLSEVREAATIRPVDDDQGGDQ